MQFLTKCGILVLAVTVLSGCCGHGCHQHVYRADANTTPSNIDKV